MPIAALFAALALFWLSTRQFAVMVRLIIWIVAASLLVFAAQSTIRSPDQFGLIHALLSTPGDDGGAPIIRAVRLNASAVAPFVQQLLDFFVAAGGLLALLSLLAFSKGESLEKFLRPSLIALTGFVGGSVATLAVVAIGFGGYVRPRTFSVDQHNVSTIQVHDGDTFRIGDYNLRLYGIDAPELDQVCGSTRLRCGEAARDALSRLLQRGVQCDQTLSRRGRVRDALGRPLVRCLIPDPRGSIDASELLVRQGYAVQYLGEDYGYGEAQRVAAANGQGLMGECSLRPDAWRDREARVAFENNRPLPPGTKTMGNCGSSPPLTPLPPLRKGEGE